MDSVNNSERPKQEDPVETKSSLSAELFCDQVLGEPSVVSSHGVDCSSSALVVEENGGGGDTFSPGENDSGLEFVGIPGELLVGVTDFGENEPEKDSIFAGVDKELMVEQPLENAGRDIGGGPRVEEVPAVEASARVVQMQEEEKGSAALEWNEVDSPGKIDVSNDGISLIVEFFGPPNGTSEDRDGNISGKEMSREGKSVCQIDEHIAFPVGEEKLEGSGQISKNNDPKLDVKENPSVDDNVGKEIAFLVGAVVWAKTKKTKLWWPGVICDPIDSNRRDPFLVRYLASANTVRHSSSQLRHFLEGFDQFCQQQDSKSFHAAVERAIFGIGERVKAQMTCPCFTRDGDKSSSQLADGTVQRYLWSEDKLGVSCSSSRVQFHPAGFLAVIKYLAQNTAATDKIKLISTRSCLTAIYRSLGHHQLPIQQLAPDAFKHSPQASSKSRKKDGAKDELLYTSSSPEPVENDLSGGESLRRRRKSKYLSYPFIDPKKSLEGEKVSEADPQVDKSKSSEGSKSKKPKKTVSGKFGFLNLSSKCKDISSSSENILSDLCCQALDCLPPKRRSYSDSVCRFLCGFRRFIFLKPEIAKEHVYNHEDGTPISPSCVQEGSNEASGVAVTPSDGAPKKITPSDGTPKKSRKRKEVKTSSGTMPSGGSHKTLNASEVTECHDVGSGTKKSEKVAKKRKNVIADSSLHVENPLPSPPGFGLPDLNRNIPAPAPSPAPASADVNQVVGSTVLGLQSYCMQTAGGLPNLGRSNSFRFVQLLKDVQTMGPNFLHYMAQTDHMKVEPETTAQAPGTMFSLDVMAPQLHANGSNWQVGSVPTNMQPLSPGPTDEKKKRKRKAKALDARDTTAPSIPDLNGKAADCVSPGSQAPVVISSAPKAKLPIKRRNMAASVVPHVNGSLKKVAGVSAAPSAPWPPQPLMPAPAVPGSAPPLPPQPLMPAPAFPGSGHPLPPQPLMSAPAFPGSAHPLMPAPAVPGLAPPLPPQPPQMPIPVIPVTARPGDQSNLLAMQKNLKMMTSMLEKAGNSLSFEKRTVLETEINGLMKKISTMVGSSSSSA